MVRLKVCEGVAVVAPRFPGIQLQPAERNHESRDEEGPGADLAGSLPVDCSTSGSLVAII